MLAASRDKNLPAALQRFPAGQPSAKDCGADAFGLATDANFKAESWRSFSLR
jgi:hypothetical protein